MGALIHRCGLPALLFACGPGPTTSDPTTPTSTPSATSTVTPTKVVRSAGGPDCKMKAMAKLTATITDAGMRTDLESSAAQDDVAPSDSTAVLEKLGPSLTACNPQQVEGCAYVTTSVAADGAVTATETFVSDGLPNDVVECLRKVIGGARFAAVPKAGKMTVPVTFTRSR